jgi:Fe-S-cluster formation regulator IscX/YfhJ
LLAAQFVLQLRRRFYSLPGFDDRPARSSLNVSRLLDQNA